ncbi:UDP-N-acetylmuramoyl-L-alanyl-D-glutamate--2,6-diaminopimelate ligase [Crassaminicella thermophila]|uniref:UDP-N-acetylmuramoyl-L-alanyl-D-glutamate--2,6-diaminopimelate ligase n=1 Tax=Crassaminicella thermophila TaxID=2599308 RepID=A0A5C0SFC5_CRATE|nr:UDP-N-acetylmuramoyl-L-alanyl-D-glutamate--2,6-diaminopimelate ligase [Crassaminicella thermophila]QEK11948.1 UDP-N-acetylmuramoyl-L-alanyl-D-glutamate--2,6-diaminopimelate ligase [Crassaminicella thermophila]
MKINELLNNVSIIETIGDMDIDIEGIAYDSRKVKNNYVFVCIIGIKTDGHNYIDQAVKNGAKVLILEKNIAPIEGVTIIKVENSRKALAIISSNFFKNPTKSMNIIGVTGTNGKTTTTHLIKNVLEKNDVNCGLIGTISYQILDKEYKANNTTPESLELQKLFQEMKDANVDTCAMEVSSHSLELDRVAGINYKIGVFTNLTADHMDFHKTIENYKNAKAKLFYQTSLANIINIDDKYGYEIADEIKKLNTKLVTYGINKKAEVYAEDICIFSKGCSFTLVTPKFKGKLKITTPGMFSVYNALAAIAVCYVLGYNFDQIKKGIESVKGVSGRFETVENTGDVTIIVDYSHTPDALENALNTIKQFVEGKIITVFGCGGDRDKIKRPMMGETAGKLSDYCIITSDNPRSEQPDAIIKDIEVGIKKTNCKYKMIVDRKEAIREAIKVSESKDIILIAGKGHETYQIIGDKIIDFDDKKVAQEILREER